MEKLEPLESGSALWTKLAEHFAERRDTLREKNDNPHLEPNMTLYVRGQISVYKDLLELSKPVKKWDSVTDS